MISSYLNPKSLSYLQIKKFIFLIGPNLQEDQIVAINKGFDFQGLKVHQIGDGKKDLDDADRTTLHTLLSDSRKNTERYLLFIFIHGNLKDGKHYLGFGKDNVSYTRGFLIAITNILKTQAIDIFLASCYSGAALPDAFSLLPKSSNCIAISAFNEAHENYVWQLGIHLQRTKLQVVNAESFFMFLFSKIN